MSGEEEGHQRVVLETDRVVDAFLFALAKKYGTQVVAVRVDPYAGPATALSGGDLAFGTSRCIGDDRPPGRGEWHDRERGRAVMCCRSAAETPLACGYTRAESLQLIRRFVPICLA